MTKRGCAAKPLQPWRAARWSAGSRAGWNGARARWATDPSSATRKSFRPFAPSVLQSAVGEWFEQDGDVPFMMQVYQIREEKRALIPAVAHVDGSGRLQTVYAHTNPRYHALITAFHAQTGVPMVLNTSFNENEPVVCTPAEALDCFLRTKMDVLVMGDWVVRRGASGAA